MNLQNAWVIEYSVKQKTVHVDTVENTIARNARNIRKGSPNDYMMVGIYETADLAYRKAEEFRDNVLKALSIYVDIPQSVSDIMSGAGTTRMSIDPEMREHFKVNSQPDPIPYEGPLMEYKALMDLEDEDLQQIGIYKDLSSGPLDTLLYCVNIGGERIYFTKATNKYIMRNDDLTQKAVITTTADLIHAARNWQQSE